MKQCIRIVVSETLGIYEYENIEANSKKILGAREHLIKMHVVL